MVIVIKLNKKVHSSDPGWNVRRKDGETFYFPNGSALTSMTDRYGNYISITRNSSGGPTEISDSNGRYITLQYSDSNNPGQWYRRSSAPFQLLAMAVMRAVENRTPVIRVGNTGISAVITPVGRVENATQLFTRTTEIETVEWKNIRPFYSQAGDIFAWLCAALLVMGLLAAGAITIFRDRNAAPT